MPKQQYVINDNVLISGNWLIALEPTNDIPNDAIWIQSKWHCLTPDCLTTPVSFGFHKTRLLQDGQPPRYYCPSCRCRLRFMSYLKEIKLVRLEDYKDNIAVAKSLGI